MLTVHGLSAGQPGSPDRAEISDQIPHPLGRPSLCQPSDIMIATDIPQDSAENRS
jgi:hypothetical protein